jgi:glutathione synthase/RimK-type ligase-like ATP-grasp enzyme
MHSDIGVVYLRKLAMPETALPASDAAKGIWQSLMGEYYQAYLKPIISQAAFPINNYSTATQNNKYETLLIAKSFGLAVPETIITNTKKMLLDFLSDRNYSSVITKPADELCSFSLDEYLYKTFTKKISIHDVSALPEKFFPSLFQQAINNITDIKTVYCFGRFFTAACLQTADKKTDFRNNYVHVKTLPYKLPDEIENKLDSLFKHLGLSICTADFILSDDGTLYFLEINPFGQFGSISLSCNYFIERFIAEKFAQYAS